VVAFLGVATSNEQQTDRLVLALAHQLTALTASFLGARLAAGAHPNTVRKCVGLLRAHYRREYDAGRISPETLLAVLSVKPLRGSSRQPQPQPYRRKELSELWATPDERWPRLDHDPCVALGCGDGSTVAHRTHA
jgi:hypothetical protein